MFSGLGAPAVSAVNEHGALTPDVDTTIHEPSDSASPRVTTFDEKVNSQQGAVDERHEHSLEKRPRTPSPPMSPGATLVRKFGSLLVGRGDESRKSGTYGKRASILGGFTPRPSTDVEKVNGDEEKKAGAVIANEKDGAAERTFVSSPVPMLSHSQSQHLPAAHRRATTVLDPHARASRHERRSSTGGSGLSGGSVGRHRRPSTGFSASSKPLGDKIFGRTEEEDEAGVESENGIGTTQTNGYNKGHEEVPQDDKDFKPVFLKGLFRYAG
jgi:hypothetical protein